MIAKEKLAQAWARCEVEPLPVVATAMRMTQKHLVYLFDLYGMTGKLLADPSPDEIGRRARKIRSKWSAEEKLVRQQSCLCSDS